MEIFALFLVMSLFLTCIVLGEGRGWFGNKETLAGKSASVSINAILTTNTRGVMFFYEKNVMHVLLFKPPLKPPATCDSAIASG